MLVVFEGIDGSGKTTISNRVAAALAASGLRVSHVRSGGLLASEVAEGIRQFTRDQRNLALTPFTEFLLYVAREAQLLEEAIRPALATHDIVIADRFFYTAEILARYGRGLPRERLEPVLAAASAGTEPDLVILVAVDPHVAQARRRAEKILRPTQRASSRKGCSGTGLAQRLRDGYLETARADPSRWLVLDNTETELDAVVDGAVSAIRAAAVGGAAAARQVVPARRRRPTSVVREALADTVADPESARAWFLAWIDRQIEREPTLAATMMYGLHGDGVDERRLVLAERCPAIVAYGLRGLGDDVSWELRHRLLRVAPRWVARSLADLGSAAATGRPDRDEEAWMIREALWATVPADVAASLDDCTDDRAWGQREKLWALAPDAVLGSLAGDDAPRAWELRAWWLTASGGEPALTAPERARALASSLRGLGGKRAWQLRRLTRAAAPVATLLSLEGVDDDRAWAWRARDLGRAPRPVLRTLDGVDEPRAWALREAAAPRCKEALDSIVGMDQPLAWALRDRCADLWPSTVAKSLGPLGAGERGRRMIMELLRRHPGNLSLIKHAAAVAETDVVRDVAVG